MVVLTTQQQAIVQAVTAGASTSTEIRRQLSLNYRPTQQLAYLVKHGLLRVVCKQQLPLDTPSGFSHTIQNVYGYTGKKYQVIKERKSMGEAKKRLRKLGRKTTNGNKVGKKKGHHA